ncbi:MAG: hypothetical protein M1838_000998 [Thelocarpon superellum]|nr:MAG: hypothetical protein M1838_000998 [Thelocarpon superellum]
MPSATPTTSTGLTITNPLVLYRALVATKRIDADPAQHRLALHLQKLYHRLKDYEPTVEYSARLKDLRRLIGEAEGGAATAGASSARRRRDDVPKGGIFSSLLAQKDKRDILALTRVVTSHEEAMRLTSPQGLLLHGEVGTGKSMLVDLLADCLPNRKKRRWHFNTFMLDTFRRLEQLRREQQSAERATSRGREGLEAEYSLLRLARDLISTSPILFLDEFQLPDRAASKILLNLLTSFFHLGGVLIATSNRMPEELAKASGMEFAPPASPSSSAMGLLSGGRWERASSWGTSVAAPASRGRSEGLFGGRGEFVHFVELLKARCEVWDMEGGRDWRRREAEDDVRLPDLEGLQSLEHDDLLVDQALVGEGGMQASNYNSITSDSGTGKAILPKHYIVQLPPGTDDTGPDSQDWSTALSGALHAESAGPASQQIRWQCSSMHVYGRSITVPRAHQGISSWTFAELCGSNLGPADYITLAATFDTLVLTDVPVLTLVQKNEARRLITLLDALYEARCKLLVTAAAGPDALFFPETATTASAVEEIGQASTARGAKDSDAVYAETFAEMHQDATAPFRPNIATYEDSSAPSNGRRRSVLADEDSDFGPIAPGAGNEIGRRDDDIDFSRAGTFTGEDERFAYKRASSRLWEMCSARWWARTEPGWWRPLPADVRRWETTASEIGEDRSDADGTMLKSHDELFRHGASPFRVSEEAPPKFAAVHAWGMMQWGKKAGRWGKGAEAFAAQADHEKSKDRS